MSASSPDWSLPDLKQLAETHAHDSGSPAPLPSQVQLGQQTPVRLSEEEIRELTQIGAVKVSTPEERNYALAHVLIAGQYIPERQLRKLLRRWTTHGELTLEEFLRRKGALADSTLARIVGEATRLLETIRSKDRGGDSQQTNLRQTSVLLEKLDPNGQLARLFGVSRLSRTVTGNLIRVCHARYRIIRKLGEGGLGTVWLAHDTFLNRHVAIKEVRQGHDANPVAIARFHREAEITGQLEHPGIVPIHMLGKDEATGNKFYVMRFLGNHTLQDKIREYFDRCEAGHASPVQFMELITAFLNVCQAVAYAHSRKVIHRDLKPTNIALDSFGQVIVLDWGLARHLSSEETPDLILNDRVPGGFDAVEMTLAGQVMGTPMFMAPEQAAGRTDETDELTDVYGLGAILYAILTGYAPHERTHAFQPSASRSALLDLIVDADPPPPRRLNRKVDRKLEAICMKAIARERHARYESAQALADDIQRWMANEPVSVRKDSLRVRAGKWFARHPWTRRLLLLLTAGFMLSVFFLGALAAQMHTAMRQQQAYTVLAEGRNLRTQLNVEGRNLERDVYFLSTLPSVEEVLMPNAAQTSPAESRHAWMMRLQLLSLRLLNLSPEYASITCWQVDGHSVAPVAYNNGHHFFTHLNAAQSGFSFQTFASQKQHLPAIMALPPGDTYLALLNPEAALDGEMTPGDLTLIAAAPVYNRFTGQVAGCVTIECDLEMMLRDLLLTYADQSGKVYVTDHQGLFLLVYSHGDGLRPLKKSQSPPLRTFGMQDFLNSHDQGEVVLESQKLCVAKVSLSSGNPDAAIGLVLTFP